ncbi:T9SS type A sorting domain-containing protein [uncultured Draconibacterium sp.]|uniref:T9SS type A sorting domain-containing protein n=1 Tax=uncultured Draconibacterium sp. TaxID=1573823 RepID=UPI003217F08A
MKHSLLFIAFLLFTFSSFAQLRYTQTVFNKVDTIKDMEFAQSDWLNNMVSLLADYNIHNGESKTIERPLYMDIYSPHDDTVSKRPAILFGFSGGFLKGSRHNDDMIAFCDSFARRGYVTANFDYRIGMGADVTMVFGIPIHVSISERNGARTVYRAVQDSRAAIRFLKHNANEFGIDTTKIYLAGSSAGGFVALHNLYMDKPDEIPPFALGSPTLGNLDTVGIQGYDGRANAIVSMWGALQTPDLIENEQRPALLIHGEEDDVVYFKKGVPLKTLIPDLDALDFNIPETYGGYCIDTALINRNIPHNTYFVPGKKHEFYGVKTGNFGDNGPNQYWDTVQWKISDFLFEQFKPIAEFEYDVQELTLNCFDNTANSTLSEWDFGDETIGNGSTVSHSFHSPGYYKIILSSCNANMACDTLSQIVAIGNPTQVQTSFAPQIKLFPNPAIDQLHISGIAENSRIEIIDLLGRTAIVANLSDSKTVDVSLLNTGIYILKIEREAGTYVQKFQKVN